MLVGVDASFCPPQILKGIGTGKVSKPHLCHKTQYSMGQSTSVVDGLGEVLERILLYHCRDIVVSRQS
jgi:hypothetical protein